MEPTSLLPRPVPPWRRLAQRIDLIFVMTVVLPTMLACIYYGLIASDVYVSESRFVIRSPERPSATGLASLLQGTSLGRSQDDTYSVIDFIRSRDALGQLDQSIGIRKIFEGEHIDFINRFPGLDWDDSFEALHAHYQDHVTVDYNTTSSITSLTVQAYKAADAQRINQALLEMSERLVNGLNARIRSDLIETAQREVSAAEERSRKTAVALSEFRSKRGVFDPNAQSGLQLQGVARLQEELLTTEAQLAQIRKVAPNNPQVASLTNRIEVLRQAIASESARVTGGAGSLSAKSPTYERLVLEKTFADQQLGAAMTTLETARHEAMRKHLYLERLVQPNLPDESLQPRRLRSVITVLLLSLVAWGVVSLIVAGVREHRD